MPTTHFISLNGSRLQSLDEGSGQPLLLLHGGGPAASGGSHWVRNIEPLSADFRVIALDFPGFGQSERVPYDGLSASAVNARAAAGLLEALGLTQAAVVGYSMGGSAGFKMAAEYPDRVSHLIALGGGGASLPSPFGVQPTEGARLLARFTADPTRANFDLVWSTFLFDPTLMSQAYLDEMWQAHQSSTQAPISGGPAAPDNLLPDFPRIQAPTLVVRGRDDRYGPVDQGLSALTLLPNAELHVYSRCGHWIQYEKSEGFHTLLRAFINR
ncbi:MAG: alpha/beta fold hydrolase [Chloroflexota bacterium]